MPSGRLVTPTCWPSSSKANPNLCDHDVLADRLEGLPDQLLVVKRAVDLRGVEEG
jgi:hypothetical protein